MRGVIPDATYEEDMLDVYGECTSDLPVTPVLPRCRCLKVGWVGRKCKYWKPLGVKTQQELLEYARVNHTKLGY